MKAIYVSPGGNGSGAGTADAPVTLERALALVAESNHDMTDNIEVVLAGGYYHLDATLALTDVHSGSELYPVVFKAAAGEEPVLGSAYTIKGSAFSKWADNEKIYVADVPASLVSRQLFVDNIRAVRARSERGLDVEDFLYEGDANMGYVCRNVDLLNYKRPQDLELVFQEEWTNPRIGVSDLKFTEGRTYMTLNQPGWTYIMEKGQTKASVKGPVYYENAIELLDTPGEWYLDTAAHKLYYMPRVWEDMNAVTITMPVLTKLVTVIGTDYDRMAQNIRFEGITFADTTWLRPSSKEGHADVQNNHIRQKGIGDFLVEAAVTVKRANSVCFTNCTFTRLGATALKMVEGVQDSFVTGCHFFDISGGAINIGDPKITPEYANPADRRMAMKNCDVLNNYIHDIGVEYKSAAAVSVGFAADMDLSCNEIFHVPYSGFHIGYGGGNRFANVLKNMVISQNFIHDFLGDGIYDGGAIYILGNTSGEGYNIATDNYIRKQMDRTGVLYPDQGTTYFKFERNVIDLSEVESWTDHVAPKWSHTNGGAEHVHFRDNYVTTANYATGCSSAKLNPAESDVTFGSLYVDPHAQWDEAARGIIAASGLQERYAGLRNGQAERILTNLPEGKLCLGTNETFVVTLRYTDGKDRAVSGGNLFAAYAVEDASVAVVTDKGVVTGLKKGVTKLRIYVISNNVLDVIETKLIILEGREVV